MIGINRQERPPRADARPMTVSRRLPQAAGGASYSIWTRLAVIPLLWSLAALALSVDMPVARFWLSHETPGFIVEVFESAEGFGNGAGVVMLILVLYSLQLVRPRVVLQIAMTSLGSGLVADGFKLIIARCRPRNLTDQASVFETFGSWWPGIEAKTAGQSFPSAHVATAVGMACALSYLYPRGRWVFGSLALLVMLQRLQTGAHFVSDTISGAAIAWGTVLVMFHVPFLARWFKGPTDTNANSLVARTDVPAPHLGGDR